MTIQAPPHGAVKVKRDGPRGWHWIAAASYDPARHELVDDAAPPQVAQVAPPMPQTPRKPRRAKTNLMES